MGFNLFHQKIKKFVWHITVNTGWTALDIHENGKKKTEDETDNYVDIMAIAGNPVCRSIRYTEERKKKDKT